MNYWVAPDVSREKLNKEKVIFRVCKFYDITVEELLSKSRLMNVVEARSVLAYILHIKFGLSTTETGKLINRDHSTVTHFKKKIQGYIQFDEEFANKVKKLQYNYY